MSTDELVQGARKMSDSMAATNPFLGIMLVFVILLVGWYVYQQQQMDEKLIELQEATNQDRRDKTSALRALVESNTSITTAMERTATSAEVSSQNLASLIKLAQLGYERDVENRRIYIMSLEETKKVVEETGQSMEELKEHLIEVIPEASKAPSN